MPQHKSPAKPMQDDVNRNSQDLIPDNEEGRDRGMSHNLSDQSGITEEEMHRRERSLTRKKVLGRDEESE